MKLRVFTQCLLSAIASVFLLAVHHLQQPKWPLRMTAPAWATAVFDSNQQLLDVHIAADQQWRLPYQAAELPHRYQIALLSFEDQYFFDHPYFQTCGNFQNKDNPPTCVRAPSP